MPDSGLRTLVDNRGTLALKFFESSELCDGTVVIGDRTFPISRMMLAAASPFFAGALASTFREGANKTITLDPTLAKSSVEALIRFAHGGASEALRVPADQLENLVVAADQLGFTNVLRARTLPPCPPDAARTSAVPTPRLHARSPPFYLLWSPPLALALTPHTPAALAAERLRQTLVPANTIERLILAERHSLPTLARGCIEVVGQHYLQMRQAIASLSQGCLELLLRHEPAVRARRARRRFPYPARAPAGVTPCVHASIPFGACTARPPPFGSLLVRRPSAR